MNLDRRVHFRSGRLGALALAAAVLLGAPGGVSAVDRHDHEQAREALAAGEILPLKEVLERVERQAPGKVLAIELERHRGRWLYEIKLLRPGGALVKVWVNAADGTLVARRGQGSRPPYCAEKDPDACPDR